jgi:hypothetical protein
MQQQLVAAHQESLMHRFQPNVPRRMCTFPHCKSPFDSPQWRRGPLGPGTLCNACGTRYARLQNKISGEKKVGGARTGSPGGCLAQHEGRLALPLGAQCRLIGAR